MKEFLLNAIIMNEEGTNVIQNISDFLEMEHDIEITLKDKKAFYELVDILERMECKEISEGYECNFDTDDLEYWYKYENTVIKLFYLE